jgi:two-component system, sensor histidine kinase
MMVRDQPAPQLSRSLHVLVVEDNPDGRDTLSALLELLGHQVETAEDGLQGVYKALTWHPEVAFVDIGLPVLDGYQVAQRLRAALGHHVFLIAYTAYNQPEDQRRAFASGFDAYLVKPVELSELDHWLTVAGSTVR